MRKSKIDRDIVVILIMTLVTISAWVGFETYRAYTRSNIPPVLGILAVVGGLVAGVVLLNQPLRNLVGASPEETPKEVKITNVSDTGFVVSWLTDKSTSGYVQHGEKEKPELVISDDRDQERGEIGNYFTHLVTVKALKP